ncbi:glycosyltransferase family 4 protein [Candidatus Berkelbacteria bacterium]|nr:glycosyltransferase family 4 protein [Candidatus Berkelbacteria bacterium]
MPKLRKPIGLMILTIYQLLQAVVFLLIVVPLFLVVVVPASRIRLHLFRPTKPRILWAPIPIINIHYNARADRVAGYASDSLVYTIYHMTHESLFTYNLSRWYNLFPIGFFVPLLTFLWASLRYDLFNFFYIGGLLYANPFIKYFEYPLLKLAGKKLIFYAYGADVRLRSVTHALGKYHCYSLHPNSYSERPEKLVKADIAWAMRWADAPISMGDMIEYTPGSRNDLFYWPIDTDAWQPHYPDPKAKEIVIVHAPNNRIVKGSDYLLAVIERLKKEGYPVKLDLVEKMTNEVAKQHYAQADIFAEQFLIGWHGFTAIEAMALGKPVMCFIRKQEYLPAWEACPIVNTNPDTLYEDLKRLITDGALRERLGKAGRRYVEKVYSLKAGGERFAALYRELWPYD